MEFYLKALDYRGWLSLGLALILVLGAVTVNLNLARSNTVPTTTTYVLSDEAAQESVGSGDGACGIAVGMVAGIVGLAVGGVTVGIGTAFILSAGLHAAAIYCVS